MLFRIIQGKRNSDKTEENNMVSEVPYAKTKTKAKKNCDLWKAVGGA